MRSPAEIAFRLRQETSNLWLFLRPPARAPKLNPLHLPDPEKICARLHNTQFERELIAVADRIMERRIPLLGYEIRPEGEIAWRRDYVHDRESPPSYFRLSRYLDFSRVGDHKVVWELNRHQHLVALAQAALLSGRSEYATEIFIQLDSWIAQNPVARGINWASALEVAFRSLSWIWIHHLTGHLMPADLRARWQVSLYHHGCFLERNLSIYFSPNTHLQGEALALHALGLLFGVERWRRRGAELMQQMIRGHVEPDGAHFEQSSYYHVYSTDMFLLHAVLEPQSDAYKNILRRMAHYLWAIAGSGELTFFGDDDGGRLFYPFGDRSSFARSTLAACAAFLGDTPWHGDPKDLHEIAEWWLDAPPPPHRPIARVSEYFPNTGIAAMVDGTTELIASLRALGRGSAGHSHASALHFSLRHQGQAVLIDPGTYTYVADPVWRDRFRSTAAHNTIRVDGRDQADPAGPFRWHNPPDTEVIEWKPQPWRLHAKCMYRGISHRRLIFFERGTLSVIDDIEGTGTHRIEQFWHPAAVLERLPDGAILLPAEIRLRVPDPENIEITEGGDYGWRSPVFGAKRSSPLIRRSIETTLPYRLITTFEFTENS